MTNDRIWRTVAMMAMTAWMGLAPAAPVMAQASPAGDAVKGKTVFARCAICHGVEPGKNKLGPTLAGIVGRKAGSVPGFNYSPAMKAAALTWTPAGLDKYITNPKATVPGNKMIFAGLPNATDRANLIAYLRNPGSVK